MTQNVSPIETFLVCRNAMLREGIRHILSETRYRLHPEEPAGRNGALPDLSEADGALVVLDANLHHGDTPEIVRQMRLQNADTHIVVLADSFELNDMMAALNAGAGGYCLSTSGCDTLVKYLDLVMLGETVFPSAMFFSAVIGQHEAGALLNTYSSVGADRVQTIASALPARMLSTREAEILHCLMEGSPNKTIARKLDVAEATVKVHVKAILRKIRVTNRTQAAMWAVAHLSTPRGDQRQATP